MQVQDEYELNIYVDGLNIFEAPGVMFLGGEITEAICNPVPTCKLKLSIPVGWLDERSIVDGTIFLIEIKNDDMNLYESMKFRVFNLTKIEINQDFVKVDIDGIINFYDGYKDGNPYNQYSTSADLFRNAAAMAGLECDVDDTNDEQLWVAGENNLYQFLMKTATHGWADETSAMFWCLDRHKILLYKNLTTLFRTRSNNIGTFIQLPRPDPKEKAYGYTQASVSVQSGYENLINGGYGGGDHYFDLLEYDWKEVTAKKVIAESNLINISKELSDGLAESWYPFDVGNFHKNYWKAKKQNSRILSTYSTYVNVACSYFMPYRLGQIVRFNFTDSQDIENRIQLVSGIFSICAIKIKFDTKAITCNLQLVMQGLNGTTSREVY
ncbi:MAG: hypothetical protein J5691_01540 [Bacilli bacterium]|nr:hypothetical protein [Bacilli bacterium]